VALVFLALGSIAQYVVPQYGIPIALAVAVAGFIIIHQANKREADIANLPDSKQMQYPLVPKRRLNIRHKMAIRDVAQQMHDIHGHSDIRGLEADALDGVLTSDLLSRNCTICGKPRNQQGDDVW